MRYTMRIICAYCEKVLGEKESQHPGDTHTVCSDCLEEQNRLLALLIAEGGTDGVIPFMGEPMPNREISMRDYYGV
jgi:hypothetical protein